MSEESVNTTITEKTAEVAVAETTAEAAATTSVDTAESTASTETAAAEAAVALASSATATAQVINATVAKIAAKIEELANEIKTTSSVWVKIRNTVEIGTLSLLLSKAASAVSEKIKNE